MAVIFGTVGNDTLQGTEGSDEIFGGDGNDSIVGLGGDDTLRGEGGNDTLFGAGGNDYVDGGAGDDQIYGGLGDGAGDDTLVGGAGEDELFDPAGANVLDGGDGSDRFFVTVALDSTNTVTGGAGSDIYFFDSGSPAAAQGSPGQAYLITDFEVGLAGDQLYFIQLLQVSTGYTSGDPRTGGYIRLVQAGADTRVEWDRDGTASSEYSAVLIATLQNVAVSGIVTENLRFVPGTPPNLIPGTENNDQLTGGSGNDSITGEGGRDTLTGGGGNDTLDGGPGDDSLTSSNGDDSLSGGDGDDTLDSGDGNDTLDGGPGRDSLRGGSGNDLVRGDEDDDILYGGPGQDTLIGGSSNDTLAGEEGNDFIFGGDGDDYLIGGDGDDTLDGGPGADIMEGGPGNDVYFIDDPKGVVIEVPNQFDQSPAAGLEASLQQGVLDGFIDTVVAAIEYSLQNLANVENLVLDEAGTAITATGNELDNVLAGNALSNTLTGLAGDDTLDGGAGVDTAVYGGNRLSYTTTPTSTGYTIAGPDGTDTLASIERLQFTDKKAAIDLGAGQAAGNTVRVIGAAFDAPNIALHPNWVGIGLDFFDSGMSLLQVCQLVIGYMGNPTNEGFVNRVYENVVGTPPAPDARDYYVGLLQGSGGTMTQAELLVLAAYAGPNATNINLAGLQQSGVDYI